MSVYDPPDSPLDILHADHQIVVANKPAGLLSVPGKGRELADCLIARLRGPFPEVLLVHRLDRDTSGVMVFALTPHAQRHLSAQFEARRTKKVYQALLTGDLAQATGRIDLPIGVDWPNRPRQMIDPDNGRAAITDWRVMRRAEGTTRVRLMPLTGRSHQLRVHALSLGHPIVGDMLYGGAKAARMMLHAESLKVAHPDSGVQHTFRAQVPF